MLVDARRVAVQEWNEYTTRDLEVLELVIALATGRAAAIAGLFSEEAAQAILHD